VQEISIDYSRCSTDAPDFPTLAPVPSGGVTKSFRTSKIKPQTPQWTRLTQTVNYGGGGRPNLFVADTKICRLEFDIENDMKPPVLLYYRLTNFYQNHRRYVKSFDQDQLNGVARTKDQIKNGDCTPLGMDDDAGLPYYPCGLIANSLFNDTFNQPILLNPLNARANTNSSDTESYVMSQAGIAWPSDKDLYKKTKYTPDQVAPPPNWRRKYPTYNSSILPPDLSIDEPFQVWMRTAGLPTFSKLSLRNNTSIMRAGRYQVDIWDG
jgi:hypothetical protein